MSAPVGDRVSEILSTTDILLLITGVALLILGALVGNISYGIGIYVSDMFQNLTGQNVNVFLTSTLINVGVAVFSFTGIVLIVAAASHIIHSLIKSIKSGA
jgi:vacuolar-type H+-ATPase subunit I/STV1